MIGNLCSNVVDVQSYTAVQGNNFGQTDTYATAYASQPAAIQSAQSSWIVRYAQRQIDITHTVYFGSNLVIKAGYRIVYGSRIFLVKGVRNPLESNLMTVADCQEILT